MAQIQKVLVSSIDPNSDVNVRRTDIQQNVEKVKKSIETHGYWPDQPITVRPHPDSDSGYQYQYVVGQCRFIAASELGLEAIPALVLELTDDEAIRRSWTENEARGELTASDRARWVKWAITKFDGEGYTFGEAREKAAEFLGIGVQQAMKYAAIAFLPEEVTEMIGPDILSVEDGEAIAKIAFGEDPKKTLELAQWVASTDRRQRKVVREILEEMAVSRGTLFAEMPSSISALDQRLQEAIRARRRQIRIEIPEKIYPDFLRYGEDEGLSDPSTIASHIIVTTISEYTRARP